MAVSELFKFPFLRDGKYSLEDSLFLLLSSVIFSLPKCCSFASQTLVCIAPYTMKRLLASGFSSVFEN